MALYSDFQHLPEKNDYFKNTKKRETFISSQDGVKGANVLFCLFKQLE